MYADLMKITKKTIVLYLVINELKSKLLVFHEVYIIE